MLNPVHLRTLTTVLATGSFAEASRRLGYTGSAVSQQMAALERTLRTPLFEREAHGIRPTPTAELLAARASDVLAGLAVLERDVEGVVEGTVGRIRVGSFPTASRRVVPEWLAEHHRTRPRVEVELDEDEPAVLLDRLQRAELDMVLVYRYDLVPRPWPGGVTRTHLLTEPLLLLVPERHPAAETPTVHLSDLAEETWVATREGTDGARCLVRACAAKGFVPHVGYRSNDYGVIREFVRTGLGIAVVPSMGWEPSPGVRAREVADLGVHRHLFVVRRATGSPQQATAGIVEDLAAAARRWQERVCPSVPATELTGPSPTPVRLEPR